MNILLWNLAITHNWKACVAWSPALHHWDELHKRLFGSNMPPWPHTEKISGETIFLCSHTQDQQGGQGPSTSTYGPPQLKVFLKALVCGGPSAGVTASSPLPTRTALQIKPHVKQQASAVTQYYEPEDNNGHGNTCNKQLKHLVCIPDLKRTGLHHCIKYKFWKLQLF